VVIIEGLVDAASSNQTVYAISAGDTFSGRIETGAESDWVQINTEPGRVYEIVISCTYPQRHGSPEIGFEVLDPASGNYVTSATSNLSFGSETGDAGVSIWDLDLQRWFDTSQDAALFISVTSSYSSEPFDYTVTYLTHGYHYMVPDNKRVSGSNLADTFSGGTEAPLAYGRGGDDRFDLGGNATVFAGKGNDDVITGDGKNLVKGGSGRDQIESGGGDDTVYGGAGHDAISGDKGDDLIYGGRGNDRLHGSFGDDTIFGGHGNDYIYALSGGGRDRFFGGKGDDLIESQIGEVTSFGGAGNDTLLGDNTAVTLNGGRGDDLLKGSAGDDILRGGRGNDFLIANVGSDTLVGGDGYDIVEFISYAGFERNDVIVQNYGTKIHVTYHSNQAPNWTTTYVLRKVEEIRFRDGIYIVSEMEFDPLDTNDTLTGTERNDTLDGGTLDDHLSGLGGHDVLIAGSGSDTLLGGDGDDTLVAGTGPDILNGGDGIDTADYSQAGYVQVFLGDGEGFFHLAEGDSYFSIENVIGGNWGNLIVGNNEANRISGGDDIDILSGRNGADTLTGGGESDALDGDAGDDELFGGDGGDSLDGGQGNDTLTGGKGEDRLIGGSGDDTFIFGRRSGADTVMDFSPSEDLLMFDDALWTGSLTTEQVLARFGDDSSDAVMIDFESGNSVIIYGVDRLDELENSILIL